VQIGEPIETKGMSVRQNGELTERLREAIEEMMEKNAKLVFTEQSVLAHGADPPL
jgi:hypothetical protein